MKILFNDVVQKSNAASALKSAPLADRYGYTNIFTITFDNPRYIDAIGIGYSDASFFKLTFALHDGTILNNQAAASADSAFLYNYNNSDYSAKHFDFAFDSEYDRAINTAGAVEQVVSYYENGLYPLLPVVATAVTVQCNGTYIGRLGLGRGIHLGTALAKETMFKTTQDNRRTLAGQQIPGRGGYNYRQVNLDTRYKIGFLEMNEIISAYTDQINRGYPFFIEFDSEIRRLPFFRFYGKDKNMEDFNFESGIHNRYLFSRKFEFEECF